MPRNMRRKCESGIYHVMLRGIDRNNIFHDNNDYITFIKAMEKSKEKDELEIYAYCLMTNHVHILMKEGKNSIGESIKRIAVSYVISYNKKYERIGPLFQDRFKSEPINSDSYFLTVLRYILQNPIKARIEENMFNYKWSSIDCYKNSKQKLVTNEFVINMFESKSTFNKFISEVTNDKCLEYKVKYLDEEVRQFFIGLCNGRKINEMDKEQRNQIVGAIRDKLDVTNAQISRVTGLSRGILQKIK